MAAKVFKPKWLRIATSHHNGSEEPRSPHRETCLIRQLREQDCRLENNLWDAYRCHISTSTKQELRPYYITTAVIPGGCTKYVQAPDVMWNQPFKASLHAFYDEWMAGDADKQYTSGGNLKAPSRRLLVDWVLAAWDKRDKDLIIKSFKVCGQSLKPDVSEDDLILCFREGQVC